MQTSVIHGKIGRLSHHFLSLDSVSVANSHARSDRASVRLHACELYLDPVMIAGDIVAQEGRRLVQIHDNDVDATIVVEITEGAAAARMGNFQVRSSYSDQLLELTSTKVAEQNARRLIGRPRQFLLRF